MNGLYFYKLASPYPDDVTKNCRLTVNEIDSNFLNLKDADIKNAAFDCENNIITIERNNGEKMDVDLTCVLSGIDKHFDVEFTDESGCTGTGVLKFTWNEDGNAYETTIKGFVTKDNIGNYVMTEAITDGTVIGNGRDGNPLGMNPVEQTGHYRPVIDLIDKTNGEKMPEPKDLGDRYLTIENVDEYGHLYNVAGLEELKKKLDNGWRIPTKKDWDNMLNAIEPCPYRNHDSLHCHLELGKLAGKELKTSKDWPFDPATQNVEDDTSYLFESMTPEEKPINTKGTNNYGFSILPAGFAYEKHGEVQKFREWASFWTDTKIDCAADDVFAKTFRFNLAGVWQSAECPYDFRSVRLVKDYNGSNARETAYIGGKYYNEVLVPSLDSKHGLAIWTKENIDIDVSDENQIVYDDSYNTSYHKEFVINEWTGKEWERKVMPEGSVLVINASQDCNHDPDTEYRLVRDKDTGELKLVATEDFVYNKVMIKIMPLINEIETRLDNEISARTEADAALSGAIRNEISERKEGDRILSGAIDDERDRAISAETALSGAIDDERDRAISAETALSGAIDDERDRAISAETALSGAIDDERDRAISAETALSGAIDDERDRAISAETALSGAIENEIARAISAETALSGAIDDERDRAINRENEIEDSIPQGGHYGLVIGAETKIPSKKEGKNDLFFNIDGNFGEF